MKELIALFATNPVWWRRHLCLIVIVIIVYLLGRPRALTAAEDALRNAPYNQLFSQYSNAKKRFPLSLVEAVVLIQTSPQCVDKPVFLSMATVKEDLYWQLIENFVYTMVISYLLRLYSHGIL